MSNNSKSVERIAGSNPGSTPTRVEAERSDAANSGKMPLSDARTSKPGSHAGQASGQPRNVPAEAQNSNSDADRDGPSRQTSEAQDEKGQL